MLLQKINKRVQSEEEAYSVYIGILQAVTNFKITEQEKKVLSVILKNKEITKDVKKELTKMTSKARIENILSKLRARKILIGDKPNVKFPTIRFEETTFSITLKPLDNELDNADKQANS
jgi:hypothetical protein